MNTTKKVDRDKWIARASALIEMDADTRVTNHPSVIARLMTEFNISRDSARTAAAHAAMRMRGELRR